MHTDPELYGDSLQDSWLGVPYAVGPRIRVPGDGVSEIDIEPIRIWSPEPARRVLAVDEELLPESAQLESGVMVTFRFDPLEHQEVKASLEDLMRRDREPRVGPDLVVLVDGIPLGGSTLGPLLPTDAISIPILDRTAFEVATYLSAVLGCERRSD